MSFDQYDRLLGQSTPEKEVVVISRFWDHPEITVSLSRDRINVMCGLDDFLRAVTEELADPAMMYRQNGDQGKSAWKWIRSLYPQSCAITHDQLKANILAAASKALEKIKEATCQVM